MTLAEPTTIRWEARYRASGNQAGVAKGDTYGVVFSAADSEEAWRLAHEYGQGDKLLELKKA